MQAIDSKTAAPVITTPLTVIHDTRTPVTTTGKTTLWDRIAITIRAKGYSLQTERTYVHWAKAYTAWHGRRHPSTMGAAEAQAYLNHLAVDKASAPSTCKQALCALLFLYGQVLGTPLPHLELNRPKSQPRLPVVLSVQEVRNLLAHTSGITGLVLRLQYGTGMRLQEALTAPAGFDAARRVVTLASTKTTGRVQIPVGRIAARLLMRPAFTVGANEASTLFAKLCRQLLISEMTFHDSRATALTLLAKRVDVLTLAKISRHKNLSLLMNTYYRESAEEIAARL